ncbi:hypothetical protein AX15_004602 [Amanita polypyramis BW_CC]|nr:hypothetical protein AX15_004602 [Amanita polypyramis BW_CC]
MLRQITRSSFSRYHIPCPSLFLKTPLRGAVPTIRPGPYTEIIPVARFHSSPKREGYPLIPLIATVLKASTALEFTRTASRIAMTLVPVILFGNHKSRRTIKHAALHGVPASEEKVNRLLKKIRARTLMLNFLFLVPFTLFWATIIASLEQTPLTGRWRMIILSPDEEDEIAKQLAGPGWYHAVEEILSQDGTPRYISPDDWRYAWVSETLRRLEATIPILIGEKEMCPDWTNCDSDGPPMPPPARYPLTPRPRASEYLHRMCEMMCSKCKGQQKKSLPVQSPFAGPPYSLLVVDMPDAVNAFSYGFGPDGGGGIVVYSGFLDEVISKYPAQYETPLPVEKPWSWWPLIFGKLFTSPSPPFPKLKPTPEQTTELAILLAHELSHLILSHHLETLSSSTVVVPGVLSIAADVIRVLIFPITMMFGPFVNDAVAQLGKVGSVELSKFGEYCTSWKQEIEADVVSARLLAHAGFDARAAVKFWEERASGGCLSPGRDMHGTMIRGIRGGIYSHPLNEMRIGVFKEELQRWEDERKAILARQRT